MSAGSAALTESMFPSLGQPTWTVARLCAVATLAQIRDHGWSLIQVDSSVWLPRPDESVDSARGWRRVQEELERLNAEGLSCRATCIKRDCTTHLNSFATLSLWNDVELGEVVTLHRGYDLPAASAARDPSCRLIVRHHGLPRRSEGWAARRCNRTYGI